MKYRTPVFVISFFFVSCGNSPLANHKNAGSISEATAASLNAGQTSPSGDQTPSDESTVSVRSGSPSSTCKLQFKKSALCVSLAFDRNPQVGEDSSFVLKFWKPGAERTYVDPPSTLHVFLWMPSMGHGSAKVKIEHPETGTFDVTNVYFTMPGVWDVHIQLIDNNQKVLDEVVPRFEL